MRVQLYANGKKEGTQVTLNEGNKWTHTWTDLNENANGKPIKYTVKEVGSVDGYEVAVDNGNKGNLVITNTFIEEIPPFDDSGNEDDGVDGPSFEGGGFNKPNLSTPDFSEDTKLGLYESGDNTPNKAQKGDLPKTGEQTNPWYIVAGIILCLLAIFFIFRNRRHKKQHR
ncbi:Cna B-type domain-containing protein [Kurthia gibsonii]|nr:Cna B-type domain-containing protein [Kurthia gibsonii]